MIDPYKGKYCKDCKHTRKAKVSLFNPYVFDFCVATEGAATTANSREFGPCGPEGKLWEAKN